ncbi:MAG: hypothetical protein GY804_14755 [Alphaproteobacteria bacterium]|nr:hypothetical protein [Alphaproteobacteria bacterium]
MIYDSYEYKYELNKIFLRMEKRKLQKKWSDRSFFIFEKDFFFSFFIIRKMLEAETKLSTDMINLKVSLRLFSKLNEKTATILNNLSFDNIYDLNSDGVLIKKDLRFVYNQAIHSYVFSPEFDDNDALNGVFFNSFYEREKSLYYISLDEYLSIVNAIVSDHVSDLYYNEKINDFECEAK